MKKMKIFKFIAITTLFGFIFTACPDPEIPNQNPVANDYTFGNLHQTAGSVTAVTVTVNNGRSPGEVSNIRYNNSTSIPQTSGTYAVTFDVAATTGWNAATRLSARNLVVGNRIPVASNYTFGNLQQTAGSVTTVTITPNTGVSPGTRTIWYQGTGGTIYARSQDVPQLAGTYG